jgi:hypothetical protein
MRRTCRDYLKIRKLTMRNVKEVENVEINYSTT